MQPSYDILNQQKSWRFLAKIFLICGGIGWFASAALLIERFQTLKNPSQAPSCDISPFVSCGALFDLWQASLLGFPNAILGVAGFIAPMIIGLSIFAGAKFKNWFWKFIVLGLGIAWLFVSWLFGQSVFIIGVLCPYCLVVWFATIPLWWTIFLVTITNEVWGTKLRNRFGGAGLVFLPAIIIFNYAVIVLLIIKELGSRIASSF